MAVVLFAELNLTLFPVTDLFLSVCFRGRDSLPLVVCECNPLCGHFKVNNGGCGGRIHAEYNRGGFLHTLNSCQRLQIHTAQEPHVTRYTTHSNTQISFNVIFILRLSQFPFIYTLFICLPAPCFSSSAAEFVDVCVWDSVSSSSGSRIKYLVSIYTPDSKTHT